MKALRGLEEFYTSLVNLGAEASITVGLVGAIAPTLQAGYLSFSKSKGVFAGLSLVGSNMRINHNWNSEYYARNVRPVEIIVTREVSNPKSVEFIKAVKRDGHGWSIAISESTGKMVLTGSGDQVGLVIFGACTPQ